MRTILIDEEPWFVGKDVCTAFGDTHYRRSLARVPDDDKRTAPIQTKGGKQQMTIVNESGFYSLLFAMERLRVLYHLRTVGQEATSQNAFYFS